MHIRVIWGIYGAYTVQSGPYTEHIRSIYGTYGRYTEHIRGIFYSIYGAYTGHIRSIYVHIRGIPPKISNTKTLKNKGQESHPSSWLFFHQDLDCVDAGLHEYI